MNTLTEEFQRSPTLPITGQGEPPNQQERVLLFVYGTLKSDGDRGFLHPYGEYLGPYHTKNACFEMLGSAFPVVTMEGDKHISGELWSLTLQGLAITDHIEGTKRWPPFYDRTRVSVTNEQETVKAYIYYMSRSRAQMYGFGADCDRIVTNGNFQEWRN